MAVTRSKSLTISGTHPPQQRDEYVRSGIGRTPSCSARLHAHDPTFSAPTSPPHSAPRSPHPSLLRLLTGLISNATRPCPAAPRMGPRCCRLSPHVQRAVLSTAFKNHLKVFIFLLEIRIYAEPLSMRMCV